MAEDVLTERHVLSRRTFYRRLAAGAGVASAALIGAAAWQGWLAGRFTQADLTAGAPLVGHPAPAFTLPDLDGRSVSLTSFRGKAVLLNFWATWCIPCRSELPALQRFADEHQGHWVVLGVDELETRDAVSSFAHPLGVSYPLVTDGDGVVGRRYRIGGLPSTFAIDGAGVIRLVHLGPLTAADLQQLLTQVLDG